MKKYKGIIFDFNGTLVFDTSKHEKAWEIIATKHRNNPLSMEELKTKIHGRTNKAIFEYICQKELTSKEVEIFSKEKELIYQRLCLDDKFNFCLIPGAEDLLNFLKNNNIPMTIATASNAMNVNFYVKMLNLEKWFDLSKIIYDDGTLNGKPNPDIYEKASKIIGINPSDCIVFEDAILGIESAYHAHIGKIIAITGDDNQLKGEEKFGVEDRLKNFEQFDKNLIII